MMKRLQGGLVLLLLAVTAAFAQIGPPPLVAPPVFMPQPVGGAYQGPANIVAANWIHWSGLRAFSAAIAAAGTQTLCRLRRGGDSVEADFLVATSGGVGLSTNSSDAGASNGLTPTAFSTFGSGNGTLFVTTLYDQTGHGNHLAQTTPTNQPQLILSGLGSFPVMRFDSTTPRFLGPLSTINSVPATQPFTWITVSKRTANFTTTQVFISSHVNIQLSYSAAVDTGTMYAGVQPTFTVTDSTWHGFCAVYNGTSSLGQIDATANSPINAGTFAPTDNLNMGRFADGGFGFDGDAMEFGFNVTDLSGNAAALNSQSKSFYGY